MARYADRGVSCQKEEVHSAIANVNKGLFPGAFCKIICDDLTGDPDYCIAMHADGAGTKSSIAYMHWRETGDASVFEGIAQDALVMNTDDLVCIGATGQFLVSSTIGRNAKQITGEIIRILIEGNEKLVSRFKGLGVDLVTTGGETADVGDLVRTLIVDSTVICRMLRCDVISNHHIQPGDLIFGLSSSGRCAYEAKYNSGIGSNGLTMAKHELLDRRYQKKYAESCDPHLDVSLMYAGPFLLTDSLPGTELSIGEALLSPTRSYAPILKRLLNNPDSRKLISGIVHCSGGGQTKCLRFGKGLHYIKDQLFSVPPLFELIQKTSKCSWKDMFQIFNMGHRMEVYGPSSLWEYVSRACEEFGVECKVVGRIQVTRHSEGRNELSLQLPPGQTPADGDAEVLHYLS